jgi:uncharacterized protein (DUF2267 family)
LLVVSSEVRAMDWAKLVSRVEALAGIGREDAERALRATTSSLVEALSSDEADALFRELPEELCPLVRGHALAVPLDRAAFFENAAIRESVEIGFGIEHAECACRALAERMSPDLRERLQRHLPRLASLFETYEAPFEPVVGAVHGSTLATGRPGSLHPLSEARPERAQSHSVVRSEDPHADTKVSSARGIAEEREQRTIATARH